MDITKTPPLDFFGGHLVRWPKTGGHGDTILRFHKISALGPVLIMHAQGWLSGSDT